jgi:TRAP-type C4-dicarboxylate transport system permease small subunit
MDLRRFLEWMSSVVNKIAVNISIFLFIIMTLIVWAQIFFRFVLGDGIVWAEEIAKFMMVWMALLGSAVVFYERGHIAINFFIKGRAHLRYIRMFHALLSATLFALLIYYGINYAEFGMKSISPASGIKRFWPYLAIPVGGAFLFFHSMVRFIHLILGSNEKCHPEEAARIDMTVGKESPE